MKLNEVILYYAPEPDDGSAVRGSVYAGSLYLHPYDAMFYQSPLTRIMAIIPFGSCEDETPLVIEEGRGIIVDVVPNPYWRVMSLLMVPHMHHVLDSLAIEQHIRNRVSLLIVSMIYEHPPKVPNAGDTKLLRALRSDLHHASNAYKVVDALLTYLYLDSLGRATLSTLVGPGLMNDGEEQIVYDMFNSAVFLSVNIYR